jgi:hypothetical protein
VVTGKSVPEDGAGIPAGTFDPYLAKSLILGDSTP